MSATLPDACQKWAGHSGHDVRLSRVGTCRRNEKPGVSAVDLRGAPLQERPTPKLPLASMSRIISSSRPLLVEQERRVHAPSPIPGKTVGPLRFMFTAPAEAMARSDTKTDAKLNRRTYVMGLGALFGGLARGRFLHGVFGLLRAFARRVCLIGMCAGRIVGVRRRDVFRPWRRQLDHCAVGF